MERRRDNDVTGTLVDINAALNGLTFDPTTNYNGPASLAVTLSDQGNTGSGGTLTDSDTIGITINPVNDAPVLSGSNDFAAIDEDEYTNDGDLVSDLLAGHVSEVDAAPLSGIAVIDVDNTNGTWQYSLNGGSTWIAFGSPTGTTARLLPSTARVRFVPNLDYFGTVAAGITFRAWDQTSGTAAGSRTSAAMAGSPPSAPRRRRATSPSTPSTTRRMRSCRACRRRRKIRRSCSRSAMAISSRSSMSMRRRTISRSC
jgi:hypothetical protein